MSIFFIVIYKVLHFFWRILLYFVHRIHRIVYITYSITPYYTVPYCTIWCHIIRHVYYTSYFFYYFTCLSFFCLSSITLHTLLIFSHYKYTFFYRALVTVSNKDLSSYPNLTRWHRHISSFSQAEIAQW